MAKFRYVHCNFWRDADVFDFTPEEKYFYLITNMLFPDLNGLRTN